MIEQFQNQMKFRAEGFEIVRQVLSAQEVDTLYSACQDEFSNPKEPFKTRNGRVIKLYGLLDRQENFLRLASHPNLMPVLQNIIGPNIVAVKNRHNHASKNMYGDDTPRFHRDILNWSRGLVSAIVFLDNANEQNGVTRLVPGSHNWPYVGVTQINGGGTCMDEHAVYNELLETVEEPKLEVSAGDVLLFDATIFHTVGENKTDKPRLSIALGYRSVDELDPIPNHNTQLLVAGEWIYRGHTIRES